GWGNVISDDGSGNEIGVNAIRRAVWAHDGMGPMTPLATALLARFDNDPAKMVTWGDAARPTDFAKLAPLVLEHAQRGDALGLAGIEIAAAGLARLATRLLDVGAPSLCLLGGLAEPLRPYLPNEIQARLAKPEGVAVEGALRLARAQSRAGVPA